MAKRNKYENTNDCPRNNTEKQTDEQHEPQEKPGMNSNTPKG